jgi:succinate dehydrogenase/fumarate reductase cytochrome b subunit
MLERVHSWTGAVPLFGYLCFHVWETAASSSGREAFLARMTGVWGGELVIGIEVAVVAAFGLHALLGVVLGVDALRSGERGLYSERATRILQAVTGVLAVAFLVIHLRHTWMLKLAGSVGPALYDALRDDLGLPFYFAVYVVGLTATLLHLAQGLGSFAERTRLVQGEPAVRGARLVAALVAAALWIVTVNTLSHFVVGRAILWRGEPPAEAPAETGEP